MTAVAKAAAAARASQPNNNIYLHTWNQRAAAPTFQSHWTFLYKIRTFSCLGPLARLFRTAATTQDGQRRAFSGTHTHKTPFAYQCWCRLFRVFCLFVCLFLLAILSCKRIGGISKKGGNIDDPNREHCSAQLLRVDFGRLLAFHGLVAKWAGTRQTKRRRRQRGESNCVEIRRRERGGGGEGA